MEFKHLKSLRMEAKTMSEENGKKEKGLSDYGIIYLSGSIEDGSFGKRLQRNYRIQHLRERPTTFR